MDGGGIRDEYFKLGDIGHFRNAEDLWPIGSASIIAINLSVAAMRLGGIGGFSLNAYFDTFGLEGILANAAWVVILFQVARWIYTVFYSSAPGRSWSPFVFVCILLGVQILHDLFFYYGLIRLVPSGRNEMIDALKKYAAENGSRAVTTHSAFLILTAIVAMWLKETTLIFSMIVVNIALYLLPFVITTFGPRPPPPPPEKKEKEKKQAFGMPAWGPE
jgi:hypothetical protein